MDAKKNSEDSGNIGKGGRSVHEKEEGQNHYRRGVLSRKKKESHGTKQKQKKYGHVVCSLVCSTQRKQNRQV